MNPKVLLGVSILLLAALVISSEVAGREISETTVEVKPGDESEFGKENLYHSGGSLGGLKGHGGYNFGRGGYNFGRGGYNRGGYGGGGYGHSGYNFGRGGYNFGRGGYNFGPGHGGFGGGYADEEAAAKP